MMSSPAILYLRLARKIILESAWRLGGADEILLATGFGSDEASAVPEDAERDYAADVPEKTDPAGQPAHDVNVADRRLRERASSARS